MNAYKSLIKNIRILGLATGCLYSLLSLIDRGFYKYSNNISNRAYNYKNRIVHNYISYIDSLCNGENIEKQETSNKIWVFWWQGIDEAPLVIKQCINSIKDHTPGREVVVISKGNISDYLKLPNYIMSKVGHTITFTHFSDIVRLKLVSQYGGGWIDAGLFLTDDLPDYISEFEYFTIKNTHTADRIITNFRWTNGFMFAKNSCVLTQRLSMILMKYWELNDYQLEYFLLDYIEDYLYDSDNECKKLVDGVPITNNRTFIDGLFERWNLPFNEKEWKEITKDTWCHRLSYKTKYTNSTTSFYNVVVNQRYKI